MNLKPLVNDKLLWDAFLEELNLRVAACHKNLEQLTDEKELFRLQGEVRAIRKLMLLREKINNG